MTTETTPPTTVASSTFEASLASLRSRLRGELILPGATGYEEARSTWNGAFSRFPAMVVRCADVIDVINTVKFAREHNVAIAVRSGGHSFDARSAMDGSLVIDLSLMKAISIDPVRKVAWVQTGLTWGEYAEAAQKFGLATSAGDVSSVGIGGLVPGGGIGWMVRKQGLTIDNVLSVEVVTADGRLLRASAEEHPDLFWALRGGGGNFGVVTAYELRLHEAGMVLGGAVLYPMDDAARIIRAAADYAAAAPDELTTMVFTMPAPPAPFVPQEWHFRPVVAVAVVYNGNIEEGERVVAPLRRLGTPVVDVIAPMPYPGIFELTAEAAKKGNRHAVRSMFMRELSDEAIATIVRHGSQLVPGVCMSQLRVLGGAMARVPAEDTAFVHRDKQFMFSCMTTAFEPGMEAGTKAWVESFYEDVRGFGDGVYVNFLGDEGEARLRSAYSEQALERLAEVKGTYDPENVFRLNQNIKPR